MTDDDYKTMRVPTTEWEAARSHKRTHDETWADVLAFYADYREAADRLRAVEGSVESDGGDPEAIAAEVARQFDYAALADQTAEEVARRLQG